MAPSLRLPAVALTLSVAAAACGTEVSSSDPAEPAAVRGPAPAELTIGDDPQTPADDTDDHDAPEQADPPRRASAVRNLAVADPLAPALIVTPGLDVPNPFVMYEDGRYLMYSSQIGFFDPSVALRVSEFATSWPETATEVLPVLPAWADIGHTWAPDVRRLGDRWVLYMTARLKDTEDAPRQCIGVAVANRPEGPFDPAPEPIVCQLDRLGSIDPRTFLDVDGRLWLHWKSDDNADINGTTTTSIYAQPLSADGVSLVGEPLRILEVDQQWEGRIVEAPDMVLVDGDYWLFYSANWFNQPAYGIGVARCEGPAGPCEKPFDSPLIATNAQGAGPGEGSLFVDAAGALWIAYSPLAIRFETYTPRPVALARIGFDDTGPYLASP